MFIEEPVLCENMEAFKEIAACTNIPIATGERLFSKWNFKVSVKYFATCIQSGSPRGEPDALLWDVDYLTHTLRLMTLTS